MPKDPANRAFHRAYGMPAGREDSGRGCLDVRVEAGRLSCHRGERQRKLNLYLRRGTDLTRRFKYVAEALASLPDETVIDGEVVALDDQGKPNFNLLQNYRSAESHIMLTHSTCLSDVARY